MKRKMLIEIDFKPTDEATDSFDGDIDSLFEDEIEVILEKLKYGLDGFDFRKPGEYETWSGTKVRITLSQKE